MPRRVRLRHRLLPLRFSPATTATTAVSAVYTTAAATRSAKNFLTGLSLPLLRLIKTLARFLLSTTYSLFETTMVEEDLSSFLSSSADTETAAFLDSDNLLGGSKRVSSFSSAAAADDDEEGDKLDKLFLVPYMWWREAGVDEEEVGVKYEVSFLDNEIDVDDSVSFGDYGDEIVMELTIKDDDDEEEGFSSHEYALITGLMWLRALKWYDKSKGVVRANSHFIEQDLLPDVFALSAKLSVSFDSNALILKIRLEDNTSTSYRKACKIFGQMEELLHVRDFSGKTSQYLMDNKINSSNDCLGGLRTEIALELQVFGFLDSMDQGNKENDWTAECNGTLSSFSMDFSRVNGSIHHDGPFLTLTNTSVSDCDYGGFGYLGLAGLMNLGNTCFMNSAIQCLAHTVKLVDYFLGDYTKEINRENPLGVKGELALAFGDLLRRLWIPRKTPVAPISFKSKISIFAPQFSGYTQHDSQEFLAFLLDGLHEDLNRVKIKPYREIQDTEGRPDEEVAEEYWQNHLARNDSVIVDLFQGQYRSALVCPFCKKSSVTFDPFMYLSLPLPSTTMRTMTLTLIDAVGTTLPYPITVSVPNCGSFRDLIEALSRESFLGEDETLLVAEIYKNKIFRFLEDPSDALGLIRDDDKLVAYRLPKEYEASSLVVFEHQRLEKYYGFENSGTHWKFFGNPLVARIPSPCNGSDLRSLFLKLISPFLIMSTDDVSSDFEDEGNGDNKEIPMQADHGHMISDANADSDCEAKHDTHVQSDFEFYQVDSSERMNDRIPIPNTDHYLNVQVRWSDKMIEKYDTCLLSSLPEVFKPHFHTKRPQESVSLYKCLEAFLKEEPLGPDDMWYCSGCKKHKQASKKLDLWRLPNILVIHLKRFSYSRFIKTKLGTFVDFPVEDLDLGAYISNKDDCFSAHYALYAIINHYGVMGGGHYTAYVDRGYGNWYQFDDDKVYPINMDSIKTSAAYVLFYRRVT